MDMKDLQLMIGANLDELVDLREFIGKVGAELGYDQEAPFNSEFVLDDMRKQLNELRQLRETFRRLQVQLGSNGPWTKDLALAAVEIEKRISKPVPDAPNDEQCDCCGDAGLDRRTLIMCCGFNMMEWPGGYGSIGGFTDKVDKIPFKVESMRTEPNDVKIKHYVLRVCKDCRQQWLNAIRAWWDKERAVCEDMSS